MKLTVHKLGRITDAELDVRPLTVFSGHNGTNKTWLAWALFTLLGPVASGPNLVGFASDAKVTASLAGRVRDKLKPLFSVLDQDDATVAVELDVNALDVLPGGLLEERLEHKQLASLYGRGARLSDAAQVQISYLVQELDARKTKIVVEFEPGLGRLSVTSVWQLAAGDTRTTMSAMTSADWDEDDITNFVLVNISRFFLAVLCLPAERAGLMLAAASGLPEAELPEPLHDFMEVMQTLRTARRKSTLGEQLLPFLKTIAGGEIRLTGTKGENKLVLDVSGQELPIAVASSLSRSVAGLSQYIRAFASPGDVLLIDELEMNAHPQAQLALVELMAVMVSYGIRIVFTTHSPYVIDHLNNLLEAGRAPEDRQEKLAEEFQLRTRRAFLPADKVSVYAFEETPDGSEVKVTSAIDPKSGLINKSTFAPVTQRLSRLFNAALDASEDNA